VFAAIRAPHKGDSAFAESAESAEGAGTEAGTGTGMPAEVA